MEKSYRVVANGVYNKKTDSLEPHKKEKRKISEDVAEVKAKRKWMDLLSKINRLKTSK